MSYTTLEVEFDHGRVTLKEPGTLPKSGHGLLTIFPDAAGPVNGRPPERRRIVLPLIRSGGVVVLNNNNLTAG